MEETIEEASEQFALELAILRYSCSSFDQHYLAGFLFEMANEYESPCKY